MTTADEAGESGTPMRVALVGLGRRGLYRLEGLSRRSDWRVAAVCDPDPVRRSIAEDFGCRTVDSLESLLSDAALDAVWIAAPAASRPRLATQALRAGKAVIVESPLGLNGTECRELLETARHSQRSLAVILDWPHGDDFATARQLTRAGQLGQLRFLRCIERDYGVLTRNQDPQTTEPDVLTTRGALWLTQLLELVQEVPQIEFARIFEGPDSVHGGFCAVLKFPGGATAHLEIDRGSLAPLHTGWMLEGTAGAYAANTRYSQTAAGEIIETPRTANEPQPDHYAKLLQWLREGAPLQSLTIHAVRAIQLIEALKESAARGPAPKRP